jgi:hypothetical protein
MNKTALTVASAVVAGSISKGLTGMITVSNPVKIALSFGLCAGTAYLATQVKGTDDKAVALQGAYMGVAVVQALEGVKAIAGTPAIADRLNPETTYGKFMQRTLGLSGAAGGVNGYWDADGNYHDEALNGYIDNAGNLNAYAQLGEPELNGGYYDETGAFVTDGLNGLEMENEALNAYEDELNGYEDDELNAYEEDELNAYEEDELNGVEVEFV